MIFLISCEESENRTAEPGVKAEYEISTEKPWTRWWWHGSSVTPEGITAELEAYAEAGIGGVEITPIYGVKGDEENFVEYLSSKWVELLKYTLKEADRLRLGVDMATGTGWPFGGPWVTEEMASKYFTYKKYQLSAGERFEEKIEMIQEPILRTVNNPELRIQDIKDPIGTNEDLQTLAVDQVRFEKSLPMLTLMAYSNQGETMDLTDKVEGGILNWTAPKGTWDVYAVFEGQHGKMVERAAPGGEGHVIDHFSTPAIEHYLQEFDQAFAGEDIGSIRAFFNDSYEVDDARGQADWTPRLWEAFEEKRGYDLRLHLPALFGDRDNEISIRVTSDYRETISDLLLETFTSTWSDWSRNHHAIIRNQAHGSPSNILDLYAASDIPETEGTDIIRAKMASSAAHVAGRPLSSAEAATWLGEHFTTNLSDLKQNVDMYFNAGINHIFYHGTTYSPSNEEYPGRLFYAAIHANPRNSLWSDYHAINQYIERTQSYLQSSSPANDVLLYLPAYDRFATPRSEKLEHFDGFATGRHDKEKSKVRILADRLQNEGYAFDFISDRQIRQLGVEDGVLVAHGKNKYKAIVIPQTQYMPLATMKKLKELADEGIAIIFDQSLPSSVPGLHKWEERNTSLEEMNSQFHASMIANTDNISTMLLNVGIARESLTEQGLEFHRRRSGSETLYFVSNWSESRFDGWVDLTAKGTSIIIIDPMTGREGVAEIKDEKLRLQLNHGASLILKIQNTREAELQAWDYIETDGEIILVEGTWQLDFLKGGPTLPSSVELESLQLWTELEGDTYQYFSGSANYSIDFDKPQGEDLGYVLDLGTVKETAKIIVNDQDLGTCIGPVYQLYIPKNLLKDKNTLEIHISNTMANRIMSLEKSGQRWQKFYNINVSANKRENLGSDRVFTTKNWKTRPSGLAGPVLLIKQ